MPAAALHAHLLQLVAAQLITAAGGDDFAFRHALVGEAVYTTILRRERPAMHRAVAEVLEDLQAGALDDYLPDLAQTKIASVHPLQRTAGMDLRTMKAQYGDRWCLIGNIDSSRTLPMGTPEDVAAEVREAIDIAAPGGGYILGSDHSLHDGISVENIVTLFRVGAEYGGAFYARHAAMPAR